MSYALNLDENNRILSVTYPEYSHGNIIVDRLPNSDVSDYLYIDEEFIYDPLPEPEVPEAEPTTEDILNVLLGVEV